MIEKQQDHGFLLETMAKRAGCEYLSDLRRIDAMQRTQLVKALKQINPCSIPLREWNDVLEYLTHEAPQTTQEAAWTRLMDLLTNPQ